MKVGIVVPFYTGKGGLDVVLHKVMSLFLHDSSVTLELIRPQGIKDNHLFEKEEYKIIEPKSISRMKSIRWGNGLLFLSKELFLNQYDIIISTDNRITSQLLFIKKIYKKKFKIISWLHFSASEMSRNKVLPKIDGHLCIANGLAKELLVLGIPNDKVKIVYNPIERQEKTIRWNQEQRKFYYIGRLIYGSPKKFKSLIEAVDMLVKEGQRNFKLVIFGSGEDEMKIIEEIKKYELDDYFEFNGWLESIWDNISEGTGLILCSDSEGFGMVLAESASYGFPVISSDCPVGPSDIVNSHNGLLYSEGVNKSLAYCMRMFMEEEIEFSSTKIKESIEPMYYDSYKKNFVKALKELSS